MTYDKGLGMITLTQKKTGRTVNVPIIDDRVYELCDKYNYDFPEISEQKMNLKIKAVATILAESVPSLQEKYVTVLTAVEKRSEQTYAKLLKKKKSGAKFTENERKWFGKLNKLAEKRNGTPLYERNKHGEVIRPKYELISSHTSRRSGATATVAYPSRNYNHLPNRIKAQQILYDNLLERRKKGTLSQYI